MLLGERRLEESIDVVVENRARRIRRAEVEEGPEGVAGNGSRAVHALKGRTTGELVDAEAVAVVE